MEYLKAFVVGGLFCALGQVLIDYTRLTPARILVSYVVAGVALGALGIYQPLVEFAGAGASVPLAGFGNLLAGGVKEVILALSPTMEGDTTNFYIFRKLAPYQVKVSILARGVSIGDELEYTDEVTLGRSIINRLPFDETFHS